MCVCLWLLLHVISYLLSGMLTDSTLGAKPHLRSVKDLFDVKDVDDVPCVLGEDAQGQGITPHEPCRVVGQSLFAAPG